MFFVAVTKQDIKQHFDTYNIQEFKTRSMYLTVIIDKFSSYVIDQENALQILESTLPISNDYDKNHTSFITYKKNRKAIEIYKSFSTGKPIYYAYSKGEFYCSSHISMLRKAGVQIEENKEVLPEFFVFRHIAPPNTLFKNIKQLSPGDHVDIEINNNKAKITSIRHFELPPKDNNIKSLRKSSKKIIKDLSKSIEQLEPYKNNVAAVLTGGLDSSILCKIYQNLFGLNHTYSTGYPFEKPENNIEKEYAITAGQAFHTNHQYYESTNKEYLRDFIKSIYLAECPIHHLQSVCLHSFFKNGIPENKHIVMQGQGGAGYFGNFRNHLYYKDKIPYRFFKITPIYKITKHFPIVYKNRQKIIDLIYRSKEKQSLSNKNHLIWSWHDFGSKKWACDYFNVGEENIIRGQYNLVKRYEHETIYDIASMYSLMGDEDITFSIWTKIAEGTGKILYSPLYDDTVLDYVFSMPWKVKLKRPENSLRKLIAYHCGMPKSIINRKKSGFGVHPNIWAKQNGVFEPLVPLASKVFDIKTIRNVQSPESKKAMIFWNILNYSIWKRLFIKEEPLEVIQRELNNFI